jgi:hypothetical protein
MNRGNVAKFAEGVGDGNSIYLKAKDFETPRKFRPLPWVRDGQVCDVITYFEGWIEQQVKEGNKIVKKDRPIRFDVDQPHDLPAASKWKTSSYKGGPEKPQTPKHAISFLAWDYTTNTIKIISFTQVSVVKQIVSRLSEVDAETGEANELFIPDLTKVDIIIKKEDEKTYVVTIKENSPNLPKESLNALQDWKWSWEEFMACENPQDEGTAKTFDDLNLATDPANKPTPNKNTKQSEPIAPSEEAADAMSVEYDEEWKEFKTPKGKVLGTCSIDELKNFKKLLDSRGASAKDAMYRAICSGIKDLEAPEVEF